MKRRRNYGFERRQRETTRRSKQDAKAERKADRAAQGPEMGAPQDAGPPPAQWEWFSTSRGRVVATPEGQRPDTEAPDDWILLTETGESPPPGDTPGT